MLFSSGGSLVELPVYEDTSVTAVEAIFISENDFTIYPNPVQDQLNIEISNDKSEKIQIELYDMLGKKVADLSRMPVFDKEIRISYDMSNLEQGIYFVSVTNGKARISKKINIID